MALTATATDVTRWVIFRTLSMIDPVQIVHSPDKPNMFYSIARTDDLPTVAFSFLLEELRGQLTKMGRTIVFCNKYDDVTSL